MTDRENPKCPLGHDMELIQVASGGWRYGCTKCATSYKVQKKASYGWLSPIRSTKELAYEAAVKRPMQKPLLKTELIVYLHSPVWFEEFGRDVEKIPLLFDGLGIDYAEFKEYGRTEWFDRRLDDYNYQWRCWADKPTEEERQNAKWEE